MLLYKLYGTFWIIGPYAHGSGQDQTTQHFPGARTAVCEQKTAFCGFHVFALEKHE